MTLDEAIIHCEEVAKLKEQLAFDLATTFNRETVNSKECKRYAEDYRQLAEWLKDYKRLKEQDLCEDCISRKMAIDTCLNIYFNGYKEKDLLQDIKKLPSVIPVQKMGAMDNYR